MNVLSRLERLPDELLEDIAFSTINSAFLGPPVALPGLLRCSRSIFERLCQKNNPYLYARIFYSKFDTRAAVRRLGEDCVHARSLTTELVRRCQTLNRLRRGDVYPHGECDDMLDGSLRVDLWTAYLMFLESDGKNTQQLVHYAQIDRLALDFVRPGGRLHDGVLENGGWTVDSEINALGVWIFWFTDDERVRSETRTDREEILQALGLLYVGSFKYASSYAPMTSFLIPPAMPPPTLPYQYVFPLSASPLSPPSIVPDHFGFELTVARPLCTPPALLSCVMRLGGRGDAGVPRVSGVPATRAQALTMGWAGATGEDYDAFRQVKTRGVDLKDEVDGSATHEHEWMRLLTCFNPWNQPCARDRVFTLGMLDGVWEGRWLAIPPDLWHSLLRDAQANRPASTPLQPPIFQQPMQFRLREHHQYDLNDIVPFDDMSSDGVGSGALRAWLPKGLTMAENHGHLRAYNPITHKTSTYQTYNPVLAALEEELPHGGLYGSGVWDIILTAETEGNFSEAWGRDRYVGRVRDWDGLVVLVQEERPGVGRWVFRGYVHGGQNLVGRWRETGTHVNQPGWEGVWSMVKRLP